MEKYVTAKKLAQILGITERRVNQLVNEEKVLQRDANGKFELQKSVHDYYKYKFCKDEELDLTIEKAKHERAKREIAEIELAKLKNKMHDAEDIERVLTGMLINFRNRILAIPSKVAPKIIGQKSIAVINEILQQELYDALNELSEYDPEMFLEEGEKIEEEDVELVQENIESSSSSTEIKDK
ncbi:DNA-packaging protein [Caloramator sp. CAR-1]|uniref:DNA-packaging protein n=1 Tax=Caloramator sp. CAR-1 TaxID=3062777 RepID=UPI0026E29C06|nr:DNA-packaging protein [Caloramator sp. CAR-1]MDO6355293.1 DNA-packaging protein [Caloramator sp. CAR-1]